jgi:hypothetical protein
MTTPSMREALAELVAVHDDNPGTADEFHAWLDRRIKAVSAARAALAAQPAAEPDAKPWQFFHALRGNGMGEQAAFKTACAMAISQWATSMHLAATPAAAPQVPDMRAICEALGFDPTNHHNAAKCPYCRPAAPQVTGERAASEDETKQATADGEVHGDVRELRQMIEDCEPYLKDGETPAQRIERERRDTEAVLNLLIREKRKTEQLSRGAPPAAVPDDIASKLRDPALVHVAMLRGQIAKPDIRSMLHLYGEEALARWDAAPASVPSEPVAKDAERLNWMSEHEAWIGWNREGDLCSVWRRSDDKDDYTPEPVCGWGKQFNTHREAIDAAMLASAPTAGKP